MKRWGVHIVFLIGLILCCLPFVNNVVEQWRQNDAIATYQSAANQKEDKLSDILEEAAEYNDMLYQSEGAIVGDTSLLSNESYQSQLDISGNGTMGSLDIPKINVELPIYHGTDDASLSNGVGHLQGTSLPVGGENTHTVLTGHRGLPSSKLLVRLDEMEKGDLFFIRVGNETLAYKVNKIQVVEPDDASVLDIEAGKDLASIVTCTPYGINTHRLIVTGKRVSYNKVEHDSIQQAIPSSRELLFAALPFILITIYIVINVGNRRRSKKEHEI